MKRFLTMGLVVSAMFVHATAFGAAQDKGQQKCINAMNKGMGKVSSAQLKANAKCASNFSKGKNMSAVSCWNTATKVDDATTKVCADDTKKCGPLMTLPTFGPTGCGSVNNYAEYNASEFASDVFGDLNPDLGITICANDKPGCKCQAKALKAANKLFSTHQKVFNKCKKSGLKDKTAPFDDVTDLDGCLSVDPKQKISKAVTKLGDAITKKCAAVAMPFAAGVCTGLNGTALRDCLEDRVRCRVCITAQGGDNLTVDCDLYDDGNSGNGSCFDDF